jgi:3-deoxy-manno-octulosonate cytidylyltransferase (CMP-KDO synthetase)
MKAAIVIPAHYASTRLPGKLLLEAGGKPVIRHTYERARRSKLASQVIVATDDQSIAGAARAFGAEVAMTSPACASGSERCAEAARALDAEIIVNLQGDEPEIDPGDIDRLIALQTDLRPFASTLVCRFPTTARPEDPSAVKAVLGRRLEDAGCEAYEALYFTRALAPHSRDGALSPSDYFLHIGVYAFRRDALLEFAAAPVSRLERIERLEQLRILEMGERILCAVVAGAAPGIDTPEDFAAFTARVEGRSAKPT